MGEKVIMKIAYDQVDSLIGKTFEAWSESGEYFLGKGKVIRFSPKSSPPKGRVIFDTGEDVAISCLREEVYEDYQI